MEIIMLKRMIRELNSVSRAAKAAVLTGVFTAILLIIAAFIIFLYPEITLALKYLYRQMAQTAATVFAQGVILGLGCDFVIKILDKKTK